VGRGEGVFPPHWEKGLERGNVPSSEKVFDCGSQNVDFYCTLSAIFAVQLPVVHAKSTAFGLRKLATACKTTVKGGKASLETIRGNIVSFCV